MPVRSYYTTVAEAAPRALGLARDDIVGLARNSFRASFLTAPEKQAWLDKWDRWAAAHRL